MTANKIDLSKHKLPLKVATLTCVRAGKAMPFTREQQSAINKYPIEAPVMVNYMGLVSDEQADRRNHGGYLKAVHQLAIETYAKINEEFGTNISVGSLGENLTTQSVGNMPNLTESSVCIGDVYQYGDGDNALQLCVVQPRRPCYKINDQIGPHITTNIASWISKQGISGWYFKVVKEGEIYHDMPVYLVNRPHPFATLERLWKFTNYKGTLSAKIVEPWLSINELEESWKKVLAKKIKA